MNYPSVRAVLELVAAAGPDAAARCGGLRIITIDGRSGAGKTELARAVAADLDAEVLAVEDLYPGWAGLHEGVQLLRGLLTDLCAHGSVEVPQWDWTAMAWSPHRRPLAPRRVLVVEGVGAGVGAADLATARVWLAAPEGVRRTRALARDGDVFAPHWQAWAEQEDALFGDTDPASVSDLVLTVE